MNKYNEILNCGLVEKQPLTIVCRNEYGNIQILQKYFKRVKAYTPYENAPDHLIGALIELTHKKGKDVRTEIVQSYQELLIYDDWIDLDIDDILFDTKLNKKGENIRYSKFPNYVSEPFYLIAEKYPDYILKSI